MGITASPTWKNLESRWAEGFENLLSEEQEAIALWWLEAETMNGTLNQYFWNSSGDLAMVALDGLRKLEMPVTLKAFESALLYFGETYPSDREERMSMLEKIEDEYGIDVFTSASRVIENLPEDFLQAAVKRLEQIYAST